jgi:hypothetical protein
MPEHDMSRDATLDALLDRAVRQETRRFVRLLDRIYTDPDQARAALRDRVSEVGPRAAGREMGADPARLGTLRPDLAPDALRPLAGEAGYAGGLAHEMQGSRGNPILAAKLLDERFQKAVQSCFSDPGRFHSAWARAVAASGPEEAARRLAARPRDFGSPRPEIETYISAVAARGRDAAAAAEHSAAFERTYYATLGDRLPRLPRTPDELTHRPTGRLPALLEMKLEAFTADFRGKLAAAYRDPAEAERRFHDLVAREGTGGAAAVVRRAPGTLGDLAAREDAAGLADQAARRGARAYDLDGIRNPAHAADVLLQETERAFARQCVNPGEALLRIQRAIRDHGVRHTARRVRDEPEGFFQPRADQQLDPDSLSGAVYALGQADRVAASYLAAEAARRQRPAPAVDLSVDEPALRAAADFAEAERLSEHKQDLHARLNDASTALHDVERTARWTGIHDRQFASALREVYRDPAAAKKRFVAVADRLGDDAALRALRERPDRLGTLKRTPSVYLGWAGLQSTADARWTAPDAATHGASYLQSRRAQRDMEWTDPSGTAHRGADQIREAATREIAASGAELNATQDSLRSLGGPAAARDRAVSTLSRLPEGRADDILSRAAARKPEAAESVGRLRDSLRTARQGTAGPGAQQALGAVVQGIQITRALAEGPGGL